MNFRQLRYFVSVIDAGSLTAAAAALGVAQPALSLHLSNLERDLGVKLLLRTARGIQPTEAGKTCCRSARIVLDEVARMQGAVSGEAGAREVSLGLMTSWAPGLTQPVVSALLARQKRVRLRVADGPVQELCDGVRRGTLNAAVMYDTPAGGDLVIRPLFRQRLFHVARAGNGPLARVALADLAGHNLVLPPYPHPTRIRLGTVFEAMGKAPAVSAEANTLAAVLSLVAAGAGEAVLPWAGPPDPAFRWTMIEGPGVSHEVSLCTSRTIQPAKQAEAITRIIAATVLETVRGPAWAGAEIPGAL